MKQAVTDKKVLMKKSINRACRKQRFAGFMYFLGTLFLAVAAYFTTMTGVIYTKTGDLNVLNFWTPIVEVFYLKFSFLPIGMDFFISLLYLFTIIFCTVNALRALAALDGLYMKGNQKIGFNQNGIAMDKLGKIFSSTFVCLAYWMYFTHMFLSARPTTLFYIMVVVFLLVHFWAGLVGAKASRFTARDGVQELPRTKGRLAPFIRNVLQFAFIGALMYYMSQANIINNFLYYMFNGENWGYLFGDFKANFGTFIDNCLNPLLQLSICYFMLVLVVHICGTTEWQKEGSAAKGMKTVRVFSMLIFAFAILFNASRVYLNVAHGVGAISMQMLYVAVLALALFILECCMAKLPGEKKSVASAETVETVEEAPVEEVQEAPVQEETAEAQVGPYLVLPVKMASDGTLVVEVPLADESEEENEVAEEVVEEKAEEPEKKMATPISNAAAAKEEYKKALKAKWIARATGNPEEAVEEAPLKKPSEKEDTFELGEEKKVKCPHCGNIVWAQVGAPAYICPECKEKFSF